VTDAAGTLSRAGARSLLLDTKGALNNLQFTGDDFFATKTVRIVLKYPTLPRAQSDGPVGPHAKGCGRGRVQADRGGLPAQAVFLVAPDDRDAYLAGEPRKMPVFVGWFAHAA